MIGRVVKTVFYVSRETIWKKWIEKSLKFMKQTKLGCRNFILRVQRNILGIKKNMNIFFHYQLANSGE